MACGCLTVSEEDILCIRTLWMSHITYSVWFMDQRPFTPSQADVQQDACPNKFEHNDIWRLTIFCIHRCFANAFERRIWFYVQIKSNRRMLCNKVNSSVSFRVHAWVGYIYVVYFVKFIVYKIPEFTLGEVTYHRCHSMFWLLYFLKSKRKQLIWT